MGGGFTFLRNLKKGSQGLFELVGSIEACDIFLISGVTMVSKETFRKAQDLGKKIVTRLDNVPRNSRNRNTGTSRLRSYSQQSSAVIWQSEWARWYLKDFVGRDGKIIHNGVDLDVFHDVQEEYDHFLFDDRGRDNYYLYSRFNRDETKNWEKAWYEYQLIQRENKEAKLMIVGKFSPENIEWDFDFFRGENFEYLGIIDDPKQMAKIYRSCGYFLATYFNDAFSNTYLEALVSGVKLYEPDVSGGTDEMIQLFNSRGKDYFSLQRMAQDYLAVFKEVLEK